MRPVARSDSVLAALVTAFLFFLTIAFSLKASEVYSRIWLYSFAAASFVSVVAYDVARRFDSLETVRLRVGALPVVGAAVEDGALDERVDAVA